MRVTRLVMEGWGECGMFPIDKGVGDDTGLEALGAGVGGLWGWGG